MKFQDEFYDYQNEVHTVRVKVRYSAAWSEVEPECRPFEEGHEAVYTGIVTYVARDGIGMFPESRLPSRDDVVFLWDEIEELI